MFGKIYIIRNHINDFLYIGSTINTIKHRFYQHVKCRHRHPNSLLYTAMAEFKIENFYADLLEDFEYKNIEELRIREGDYIKLLKPVLNKNSAGQYDNQRVGGRNLYYKKYYQENKKKKQILKISRMSLELMD